MSNAFKDARGEIHDILQAPLDGVTLISTVKGAVRGNHWHHETTQWTYILSGTLKVRTESLPAGPEQQIYEAGALIHTPPDQRHAWQALEDTVVLVFTRGPRSGADYESDTFRLPDESRLL